MFQPQNPKEKEKELHMHSAKQNELHNAKQFDAQGNDCLELSEEQTDAIAGGCGGGDYTPPSSSWE